MRRVYGTISLQIAWYESPYKPRNRSCPELPRVLFSTCIRQLYFFDRVAPAEVNPMALSTVQTCYRPMARLAPKGLGMNRHTSREISLALSYPICDFLAALAVTLFGSVAPAGVNPVAVLIAHAAERLVARLPSKGQGMRSNKSREIALALRLCWSLPAAPGAALPARHRYH